MHLFCARRVELLYGDSFSKYYLTRWGVYCSHNPSDMRWNRDISQGSSGSRQSDDQAHARQKQVLVFAHVLDN